MRSIRRFCFVLAILSMLAATNAVQAALVTWDGQAVASPWNWMDGINWVGDTAPVPNDDLVFPGSVTNRTTTNNFPANTQFNKITLSGSAYTLGGNAITIGPSGVSFTAGGANTGTVTLTGVLVQDSTFEVTATTGTGRLQWDGDITGNFAVNKTGTGMLRYTATAKTYAGNTNVNEGTLDVAANVVPNGAGKGNVRVNSGATLSNNNVSFTINGIDDGTSGGGTISKLGATGRTLTFGAGDANGSFSGVISMGAGATGAMNLTKTGTGTQTFVGGVTATGVTTVSGGKLLINSPNATPYTQAVTVNNAATLGGTGTITAQVTVQNGGTLAPGASAGTLTVNNAVLLNPMSVLAYELTGNDTTIGGGINDLLTGVTNLTLNGTLNVTNAVPNSFSLATAPSTWRLINYSGALSGPGLTLGSTPPIPADTAFQIDTSIIGQVNLRLVSTAVPEPRAFLFGGVVCLIVGVGCACRRRKSRASGTVRV
jgi:autotransporter-associated beta strand protein